MRKFNVRITSTKPSKDYSALIEAHSCTQAILIACNRKGLLISRLNYAVALEQPEVKEERFNNE